MLADVSISTAFGPRGAVSPIGLHLFELCDDEYGRGQCQTASFRQLQPSTGGVELMMKLRRQWTVGSRRIDRNLLQARQEYSGSKLARAH